MKEEFPELQTSRLVLREINEKDLPTLFAIFSNEQTMKYYGSDIIQNMEEAEGILMSFRKGFENKQALRWGISRKDTNEMIGTCGFHNWSKRVGRIEVGYDLIEEAEGRGYMSEALSAIIAYGFEEMQLNRIGALVHQENSASRNLVRKLGFQEEGILRDYTFAGGKHIDLIMHSLLTKDWTKVRELEKKV
ncbi:GNAT family N-acetyltransferase [Guptibacillus algicola]|uniref:GNAT family N-acetyltransferase n=1 Tax=Guptibacillus algicola TaxID=225844 RepID=UPI001CD20CBB|nr:GNAT family N-acetyltransferase [Alkalihalobacillus algicola]MCA0989120.1 GNAT family N-acetyltransferase [Alkalihalobacillus algicola]